MDYQDILKRAKIDDENVVCAYPYGSRVYGTFNDCSDYDFIFIVVHKNYEQFSDNRININFYTIEEHIKRLDDHEISALECQFLESGILKQNMKFRFKLDIAKLRHSLSAKSSNSWVKCKKKLTVVVDYDLSIGRKSMFHAFRIIDFGVQIAKTGKINDYASSNELHKEIFDEYDWEGLFDKFKIRYNNLLTIFRSVTHK
jgi:predicted nucleotidyltransferase